MFTLSWIAEQTTASKFIAHSVINQTYLTMCCVNHRNEGIVIFFFLITLHLAKQDMSLRANTRPNQ